MEQEYYTYKQYTANFIYFSMQYAIFQYLVLLVLKDFTLQPMTVDKQIIHECPSEPAQPYTFGEN